MPEATDFAGRSAPGDIAFTFILLALASSPSLAYYITTCFVACSFQASALVSSARRDYSIIP